MSKDDRMSRMVRPLRSGQITIPAEFRKRLGITDASLLQMTLAEGELRIKPVRVAALSAGSPWLRELYDRFAPVREEAGQDPEEEIDQAIGQALTAARKQHA